MDAVCLLWTGHANSEPRVDPKIWRLRRIFGANFPIFVGGAHTNIAWRGPLHGRAGDSESKFHVFFFCVSFGNCRKR